MKFITVIAKCICVFSLVGTMRLSASQIWEVGDTVPFYCVNSHDKHNNIETLFNSVVGYTLNLNKSKVDSVMYDKGIKGYRFQKFPIYLYAMHNSLQVFVAGPFAFLSDLFEKEQHRIPVGMLEYKDITFVIYSENTDINITEDNKFDYLFKYTGMRQIKDDYYEHNKLNLSISKKTYLATTEFEPYWMYILTKSNNFVEVYTYQDWGKGLFYPIIKNERISDSINVYKANVLLQKELDKIIKNNKYNSSSFRLDIGKYHYVTTVIYISELHSLNDIEKADGVITVSDSDFYIFNYHKSGSKYSYPIPEDLLVPTGRGISVKSIKDRKMI